MTELALFLLTLPYALLRRSARTVPDSPKRIVVIQMMKLGDMVCTTPVFRAIKEKYPDAHLTVIGNAVNQELLAGNKDVDEYIVFNGIFKMVGRLRRESFDFGCITAPSLAYLSVLLLGNVRAIATPLVDGGRCPNQTALYRLLVRFAISKPHTMHQYAPREYLRLLEPLGIETTDTKKTLTHTPEARRTIDAYLAKHNLLASERLLVGVGPSAGHKTKQWFPERFAEVIIELKKRFPIDVLLIAGKGDADAGKPVLVHLPSNTVTDTSGVFTVEETKALMASLDLFIAVDTGPIYMAEANNVPTVDITGPVDEREQPPIADMHVVVTPPSPRTPQLFVMNAREYDMKEVERQLDSITTQMVGAAASGLLEKITARRSPNTTDTSS